MKRFCLGIASLIALTAMASASPSSSAGQRPALSVQAGTPWSSAGQRLSFEDLMTPVPAPTWQLFGAATTPQTQGPTCSGGGGTCTCAGCRASATGCSCP